MNIVEYNKKEIGKICREMAGIINGIIFHGAAYDVHHDINSDKFSEEYKDLNKRIQKYHLSDNLAMGDYVVRNLNAEIKKIHRLQKEIVKIDCFYGASIAETYLVPLVNEIFLYKFGIISQMESLSKKREERIIKSLYDTGAKILSASANNNRYIGISCGVAGIYLGMKNSDKNGILINSEVKDIANSTHKNYPEHLANLYLALECIKYSELSNIDLEYESVNSLLIKNITKSFSEYHYIVAHLLESDKVNKNGMVFPNTILEDAVNNSDEVEILSRPEDIDKELNKKLTGIANKIIKERVIKERIYIDYGGFIKDIYEIVASYVSIHEVSNIIKKYNPYIEECIEYNKDNVLNGEPYTLTEMADILYTILNAIEEYSKSTAKDGYIVLEDDRKATVIDREEENDEESVDMNGKEYNGDTIEFMMNVNAKYLKLSKENMEKIKDYDHTGSIVRLLNGIDKDTVEGNDTIKDKMVSMIDAWGAEMLEILNTKENKEDNNTETHTGDNIYNAFEAICNMAGIPIPDEVKEYVKNADNNVKEKPNYHAVLPEEFFKGIIDSPIELNYESNFEFPNEAEFRNDNYSDAVAVSTKINMTDNVTINLSVYKGATDGYIYTNLRNKLKGLSTRFSSLVGANTAKYPDMNSDDVFKIVIDMMTTVFINTQYTNVKVIDIFKSDIDVLDNMLSFSLTQSNNIDDDTRGKIETLYKLIVDKYKQSDLNIFEYIDYLDSVFLGMSYGACTTLNNNFGEKMLYVYDVAYSVSLNTLTTSGGRELISDMDDVIRSIVTKTNSEIALSVIGFIIKTVEETLINNSTDGNYQTTVDELLGMMSDNSSTKEDANNNEITKTAYIQIGENDSLCIKATIPEDTLNNNDLIILDSKLVKVAGRFCTLTNILEDDGRLNDTIEVIKHSLSKSFNITGPCKSLVEINVNIPESIKYNKNISRDIELEFIERDNGFDGLYNNRNEVLEFLNLFNNGYKWAHLNVFDYLDYIDALLIGAILIEDEDVEIRCNTVYTDILEKLKENDTEIGSLLTVFTFNDTIDKMINNMCPLDIIGFTVKLGEMYILDAITEEEYNTILGELDELIDKHKDKMRKDTLNIKE